jgi:hypothetical protein
MPPDAQPASFLALPFVTSAASKVEGGTWR